MSNRLELHKSTYRIHSRVICRQLLENSFNLSPEALGMLCHLLSWSGPDAPKNEGLQATFKITPGRLNKIFKELKTRGFMKRILRYEPKSKDMIWEMFISEFPDYLGEESK